MPNKLAVALASPYGFLTLSDGKTKIENGRKGHATIRGVQFEGMDRPVQVPEHWLHNLTDPTRPAYLHEMWWIYSGGPEEWRGLRIAHFRTPPGSTETVVVITGETDPDRIGPRIWTRLEEAEGWKRIRKIEIPTAQEVIEATCK